MEGLVPLVIIVERYYITNIGSEGLSCEDEKKCEDLSENFFDPSIKPEGL